MEELFYGFVRARGYRNKEGGEEEEEEIESRKEMRKWKRMKAAERWNLEGGLMFRRRSKERSGSLTTSNSILK